MSSIPTPAGGSDPSISALQRVRLVQVLTGHQVMITAYARAITGDVLLAEDVYQEVAVILARDPSAIPAAAHEVPVWLRAVTRRKALEVGRQARRSPRLCDEVLELMAGDFAPDPPDALAGLREAMAACLDRLPQEQRTIVDARYRDDLSCEAVAERVGRSVQGVYAVLKRARLLLQGCVERRQGLTGGGA
jgi:RNA polymerase sigma-70 factor (ECF subfamily)